MSVQDGLIFDVSTRTVIAGVADGALPGTATDDRHDGGRSGGMEPLRRRQVLANFGPIGGGGGCGQVRSRTLGHQPGDQSRGRRARTVDRGRQDPRRGSVLASGRRQNYRAIADLADRRLEATCTYTSTITRDKTYRTTTTVRIYTSVTTDGAVGRYYRDITVQPLGLRRLLLFLLFQKLCCLQQSIEPRKHRCSSRVARAPTKIKFISARTLCTTHSFAASRCAVQLHPMATLPRTDCFLWSLGLASTSS